MSGGVGAPLRPGAGAAAAGTSEYEDGTEYGFEDFAADQAVEAAAGSSWCVGWGAPGPQAHVGWSLAAVGKCGPAGALPRRELGRGDEGGRQGSTPVNATHVCFPRSTGAAWTCREPPPAQPCLRLPTPQRPR
jgi:hypothetical protein